MNQIWSTKIRSWKNPFWLLKAHWHEPNHLQTDAITNQALPSNLNGKQIMNKPKISVAHVEYFFWPLAGQILPVHCFCRIRFNSLCCACHSSFWVFKGYCVTHDKVESALISILKDITIAWICLHLSCHWRTCCNHCFLFSTEKAAFPVTTWKIDGKSISLIGPWSAHPFTLSHKKIQTKACTCFLGQNFSKTYETLPSKPVEKQSSTAQSRQQQKRRPSIPTTLPSCIQITRTQEVLSVSITKLLKRCLTVSASSETGRDSTRREVQVPATSVAP